MLLKSAMTEAINGDHCTIVLLERNAKCSQRLLALYNKHDMVLVLPTESGSSTEMDQSFA